MVTRPLPYGPSTVLLTVTAIEDRADSLVLSATTGRWTGPTTGVYGRYGEKSAHRYGGIQR